MGEEIPLRWLKFEESVKEEIKRGYRYMTTKKVIMKHLVFCVSLQKIRLQKVLNNNGIKLI